MQRKTLILIFVLTVITSVVVFFTLQRSDYTEQPDQTDAPVSTETPKTAVLTFDSPSVQVDAFSEEEIRVPIVVQSEEKPITGVQLEIKYDPAVLSGVAIEPVFPSMLGDSESDIVVLHRSHDEQAGELVYIAGINLNNDPRAGTGSVAELVFSINPTSSASETSIQILPTSMVTEQQSDESILKSAESVQIQISR